MKTNLLNTQITFLHVTDLSQIMVIYLFILFMTGAFVAGIDGGLTYNSWPKMADKWIPDDLFSKTPKWRNFFENSTMTQFNHRHMVIQCILF